MVFGSGNKFRIRRSQSKASYLASRRERENGLANSDFGSYKRTKSPSGQTLQTHENQRNKDQLRNNNNNNNSNSNATILRRASLAEKCPKKDFLHDSPKKCNLPDVLPINAKITPRSHYDKEKQNYSPPNSPKQTSPLGSPMSYPIQRSTSNENTRIPKTSPDKNFPIQKSFSNESVKTLPTYINPPSPKNDNAKIDVSVSPKYINPPSPIRDSPAYINPPSPITQAVNPLYMNPPYRCSKTLSDAASQSDLNTSTYMKSSESFTESFTGQMVEQGLQLVQRSELTLRVNTTTSDAASQTEREELATPVPMRRKLQEEIECEKLSQDLVCYLSPSDRLKGILVPRPDQKKSTDYVSGLFRAEVTCKPRRSRTNTPDNSPPPSITTTSSTTTVHSQTKTVTTEVVIPVVEPVSPLSATSTYFTTSECKAKFLTRYSQDMSHLNSLVLDTKDLHQKKEELVNRLSRKLSVLRTEDTLISEESRVNEALGAQVRERVGRTARPHEAARFTLHVEEVGKITSLLLGLSGRLARVENALMVECDTTEKKTLEDKQSKLESQLEEAKKLKEAIDKRSVSVSNMLYKYLTSEEYADYDHFINMKAKLIVDSREISDKIALGEEQLNALTETLKTPT